MIGLENIVHNENIGRNKIDSTLSLPLINVCLAQLQMLFKLGLSTTPSISTPGSPLGMSSLSCLMQIEMSYLGNMGAHPASVHAPADCIYGETTLNPEVTLVMICSLLFHG